MKIQKILLFILLLFLSFFFILRFYKKTIKPKSPFKTYANYIAHTYRIGFTNLDNEFHIESLEIKGTIPDWLSGTLLRNGPAKFTHNNSFVSNWLDGLAMIHSFKIEHCKIAYTNKFLKTKDYYYVLKTGKLNYAGFVQDPCRSIFKRIASYFITQDNYSDLPNTNINIAKLNDKFIALTETPLPVEFDPQTLQTLSGLIYDDQLPIKVHDTPHPHFDFKNQEYLGYFTSFGRKSSHNLFKIKKGSTKREIIASYQIAKPAYMHSFAITNQYAILTVLPLRANPFDILLKDQAFIKNFKWHSELGTELVVIDRINNKIVGSFKTEPFFAFHTVNAFEENKNIILDIINYPDPLVIEKSKFKYLLQPIKQNAENIKLKRYTIDLQNKIVKSQILLDEQIELPRINYEKNNGKDYDYLYAVAQLANTSEPYYVANSLIKFNVKTKDKIYWYEQNCFPGEPVFISKPNSNMEDEGVVLTVVLDANKEKSFLLILNATTFKEIARAILPHHIPFGIHGQFYKRI